MQHTKFPAGPLTITPLVVPSSVPPFHWPIPGSKSITNRAFLLAALAEGETTLTGVLQSDDTRHMRNALAAMGIQMTDVDATTVRVQGGRSRLRAPEQELWMGNSGTTVRFLSAFATLVQGSITLVGDEHMAKRPISDLVEGLHQLNVPIDCATGCPPLTISGGRLPGGTVRMRGDRSSQYFSAILMAAPLAEGDIHLEVEGTLVSQPYIDITLNMMRAFGVTVQPTERGYLIPGGQSYKSQTYHIEPDASSASYAFATAAATGLTVTVGGLGTEALQGDYHFLDLLERAGAEVKRETHRTTVRGTGVLRGLDEDMHHISDTVMTWAALAPLAHGRSHIKNVANIRIKETDRLLATVQELRRLGQQVEHGEDWLTIEPRPLTPAVVHSYADHRMAMSFAVLGLARAGIQIEDPACVAKTYPTFWNDLRRLYSHVGQTVSF